ncbi:cupin domain-containing protein [Streptomyces sp. NPDC001027]|uniref:cupin domain-containing protein n=1 Tax=Streptomyces sp. NPDC001027 TaxID=3154771 RepID=UPI003330D22D
MTISSPTTAIADAKATELPEPAPKPTSVTPGQTESALGLWTDGRGAEVGYWECSPGRFAATRDGYSEICQILSGRMTLYPSGAEPIDLGPGSTIVMPEGWTGDWEIHETVRKLYVIISYPAEPGA